MEQLPFYIYAIFVLTTIITIYFFWKASCQSTTVILVIISWITVQYFIAGSGFYLVTDLVPPRFTLTIIPPVLLTILLFMSRKGKDFIDGLDIKYLTILHVIRIPVEIILLWLSIYKMIPELMSFEGRNFDILSGITAPLIYLLVFRFRQSGRTALLTWNFICVGLLINIVTLAILSAPFPFQKLAFDQPNIAVLYEPFIWLPCCIVPLVLFSHLASIRQLILNPGSIINDKRATADLAPRI